MEEYAPINLLICMVYVIILQSLSGGIDFVGQAASGEIIKQRCHYWALMQCLARRKQRAGLVAASYLRRYSSGAVIFYRPGMGYWLPRCHGRPIRCRSEL